MDHDLPGMIENVKVMIGVIVGLMVHLGTRSGVVQARKETFVGRIATEITPRDTKETVMQMGVVIIGLHHTAALMLNHVTDLMRRVPAQEVPIKEVNPPGSWVARVRVAGGLRHGGRPLVAVEDRRQTEVVLPGLRALGKDVLAEKGQADSRGRPKVRDVGRAVAVVLIPAATTGPRHTVAGTGVVVDTMI